MTLGRFSRAAATVSTFGALLLSGCNQISAADAVQVPPRLLPTDNGTRIVFPRGESYSLPMTQNRRMKVHSLLKSPTRMSYGDFMWNEAEIPPGPIRIRVDLANQSLSVFRGDDEIGTSVVLFGSDGKPTPTGIFPVLARAKEHRSSLYDAEMPFMLRLTGDGVSIHASDVRRGRATHGCIGVPPAFAARLFDQIKRGDIVEILPV